MKHRFAYALFLILLLISPLLGADFALKINEREISQAEYQFFYQRYRDYYRTYYKDLDAKALDEIIKRDLYRDLVNRELLLQAALKSSLKDEVKIEITQQEIEAFLRKDPGFQTHGKFDVDKYTKALVNPQIDWPKIREQAKKLILKQKRERILPASMEEKIRGSAKVLSSEIDQVYQQRFEKIDFKYLEFESDAFLNLVGKNPIITPEVRARRKEAREYVKNLFLNFSNNLKALDFEIKASERGYRVFEKKGLERAKAGVFSDLFSSKQGEIVGPFSEGSLFYLALITKKEVDKKDYKLRREEIEKELLKAKETEALNDWFLKEKQRSTIIKGGFFK